MGDYIKNPNTGDIIKIGTAEEAFYSRETLIRFREDGWCGVYNGEYDDTLEQMIENPNVLYTFENEYPDLSEEIFAVPAIGIFHKKVDIFYKTFYRYREECQEKDQKVIKARIVGERWRNGQRRTIFSCACCSKFFSVDHLTAMFLRAYNPEYKEIFNADQERKIDAPDLNMIEILELLAGRFDGYSDFYNMVGFDSLEALVKEYGYLSLYQFYNKNRNLTGQAGD